MDLQDYRKRKFKTIKAFAEAYGCSASTAGHILQGRHHRTLRQSDVSLLAEVLDVSFDECVDACDNSAYEFIKPFRQFEHWKEQDGLKAHWAYIEELLHNTQKAKDTGDWYQWQRQYQDPIDRLFGPLLAEECFRQLGLSASATPEQIKQAFRNKVKAMADGKGGYRGDMDVLVQAKEKALKLAE